MTGSTETGGRRLPSPAGAMTAQAFLTELWGQKLPGYIAIWQLAAKRTTCWSHPNVGDFYDHEPDVFHAIGTTARELGRGRRGKSDEIAALCGVYLDIDATATWDLTHSPFEHTISPTIVVDSGHGIHCYYLFTEGPWVFRSLEDRAKAARLVEGWVRLHPAADQRAHDLARVLRLPETVNAKDPGEPRRVRVVARDGPRHRVCDLWDMVRDVPTAARIFDERARIFDERNGFAPVVNLKGDTSRFVAKLDALLDLSPEFARRWTHAQPPADDSLSAYDLSLCTLAAGAMTDPELAKLIDAHRCQWGNGDDIMKGHREKYLRDTIAKARAAANRDAALREDR